MTIYIRNADFVVRDARHVQARADLLIEGNRVAAIGPSLAIPPAAELIDASGCAVIPGLVNAHTHLYQNFLKGVGDGLPLVPWCNAALFPTVGVILRELRAGNARLSYLWSALASIEMIRGGVTCCQDSDLSGSWQGIVAGWRDIGIRGVGAITLADMWLPANVQTAPARLREEALAYIDAHHNPQSRVTMALAPSAAFLCSDGLLQWASETTAARDLGLHIHVSERSDEVTESMQTIGFRPPERLERLRILSSRLSAAHCVHVNQDEIERLARWDVSVVHCPKSNMKLADGIAPVPALRRAGIRVALGTDGAASNDLLDMWEEMRCAALLARVGAEDAAALAAADVFEMATAVGARVCRVDAGVIEPGRLADLVIVDLSGAHLRPLHDLVTTLVFCARAADVRDTIVDGRIVMRDRRILTVNEAELIEEANAAGKAVFAHNG
jgi:5-methylthioadenosine/S-adenosylhomocysteine deaminase